MRKAAKVFTVLVFLFLYLPMLVLAVASFNRGSDPAVFKGFTLGNYSALFRDGGRSDIFSNEIPVFLEDVASRLAGLFDVQLTESILRTINN